MALQWTASASIPKALCPLLALPKVAGQANISYSLFRDPLGLGMEEQRAEDRNRYRGPPLYPFPVLHIMGNADHVG